MNIIHENMFFSSNDLYYRFDDFEKGKSNILLITGLSGSGKSTLAQQLSRKYNADYIELDMFEHCYSFENDDQLRECGEVFFDYLTTHKTLWMKLKNRELVGKDLALETFNFFQYCLRWCKKRKPNKFIIEGIQIFETYEKGDDTVIYPIIVKNTSVLKSVLRGAKRDSIDMTKIPKRFKWLFNSEKTLNKFVKDLNETCIIHESSEYVKKYKCPYCESRLSRKDMSFHINDKHEDFIPEGQTPLQVAFNTVNKKDEPYGNCIMCGMNTKWNEDKGRYERLCGSKKCHNDYVKMTEERLKKARGVTKKEMLSDPEFQEKMLSNRSISGTYKFTDGGSVKYVGSYEKNFLEFLDKVMKVKSVDIQSPGPTISYMYKGKEHFWITDFIYLPYKLVFDIKDGGSNPNNREMTEYREKQVAKEKAIAKLKTYNYCRLTDNNFGQLLHIMMEIKESLLDYNYEEFNRKYIIKINEACNNINDLSLKKDDNSYMFKDKNGIIASKLKYYDYNIKNFDWVLIADVVTKPYYRRMGLASKLLKEVYADITKNSNKGVYLFVKYDNHAAISLYKKLGFRIIKYYGSGDKKYIIMGKGNADIGQFKDMNFATESYNYVVQDIIQEAAEYSSKNKYPVFITLMHSGTAMSNLIKTVTGDEFSHACISFDLKLEQMYSFGSKKLGSADLGLVNMGYTNEFFKHYKAHYAVYVMYLDKEHYNRMKERLKYFTDHEDEMKYDFPSLIACALQVPTEFRKKYFCSRFVMDVIGAGSDIPKAPSLWTPQQISTLDNISMVNKGNDFSKYDHRITEKNLNLIKQNKHNKIKLNESGNIYGIPELEKYPMPDEKHVRSAIRFFNYVDKEHEEELAKNIISKMKKYNISPDCIGKKNRLKQYLGENDSSVLNEGHFTQATMIYRIHPKKSIDQILKTHKYEGLLNMATKLTKEEDVYYLIKDSRTGIKQFTTIMERIEKCNKLGDCKETHNYYKYIKKNFIDRGITVKDAELTIKWYTEVYNPALKARLKEIKEKNKKLHESVVHELMGAAIGGMPPATQKPIYIVNRMKNMVFAGIGHGDDHSLYDCRPVISNKDLDNEEINKMIEDGEVYVYKYIGTDAYAEMSITESISTGEFPKCDYERVYPTICTEVDAVAEVTEATMRANIERIKGNSIISLSESLDLVPELFENCNIRCHRDVDGVYVQNSISSVRSKSRESVEQIPSEVLKIVNRGFI